MKKGKVKKSYYIYDADYNRWGKPISVEIIENVNLDSKTWENFLYSDDRPGFLKTTNEDGDCVMEKCSKYSDDRVEKFVYERIVERGKKGE